MSDSALDFEYTDGDVDTNPTDNVTLASLVEQRYSRRQTLRGGLSAASLAFTGSLLAACDGDDDNGGSSNNAAPSVSAGSNTQTSAGRNVTLAGSASDADGSIGSLRWEQLAGPTVQLTSTSSATTSFIAPAVAQRTDLVFRLTATDNTNVINAATVTVSVDSAQLGFSAVQKNRTDVVTVPAGYSITVINRLGDPINPSVPAYQNNGTDTNFAGRFGDHHDALYFYGLSAAGARDDNSNDRGLLVTNHENITINFLHPLGPTAPGGIRPAAEAIKEIEAHGVSIAEVARGANGVWATNVAGALNRRITPNTTMQINGPLRGTAFVQTVFSPDGTQSRGTINNCANGYTPWGTYLTCEENWAGYFRRPTAADNPRRTAKEVTSFARYGVTSNTGNYNWATAADQTGQTVFRRWDAQATGASATADFRNEPNTMGWVVEIDPYNATSVPRKRTALGRMGHEGAWPGKFVVGVRPAWYQGDDSRGEYVYKFVSSAVWASADASATDRLSIGDKYLDNGTLYVARFNADGTGVWIPLVFGQGPLTAANATYAFADQADVTLNSRLAADAVGATRMDRPEWTAVNPNTGEMYLTLTNNNTAAVTGRTPTTTNAPNPRAYTDPRVDGRPAGNGNPNGHIVRLRETGDTTEATTFRWDIYVFGGGADLDRTNINISGLTADNDMSSPDGLWFARPTNASGQINPILWIQNDDGAYTDVTNNMMLVAIPGVTGDGAARTVTNTLGAQTGQQATFVGKEQTGTIMKRFLVGPNEAEITGVDSTPDGRTLFVNIQHPGEDTTVTQLGLEDPRAQQTSIWPLSQAQDNTATGRPRSATIVITKNDGGVVGL